MRSMLLLIVIDRDVVLALFALMLRHHFVDSVMCRVRVVFIASATTEAFSRIEVKSCKK